MYMYVISGISIYFQKFEDAFDTALDLMQKDLSVQGQMAKGAKCRQPNNWCAVLFFLLHST